MRISSFLLWLAFGIYSIAFSSEIDSSAQSADPDIIVKTKKDNSFSTKRLRSVEGTAIYEGKKNEVVDLDQIEANLATNNAREVFSRVAGIHVWESDGAGLQLGIGARGLNPNRTSEFNTRQNGYDMSADALGYPDSYYTPPLDGVKRIEIIRGAASLQYGTQFGGVVNFIMREAPKDQEWAVVSKQTIGMYSDDINTGDYGRLGYSNLFNSIGGTVGKTGYYAFYNYKFGQGWRKQENENFLGASPENPDSDFEPDNRPNFSQHTAYGSIKQKWTKRFSTKLEFTFMEYLARQAGGLEDDEFVKDPKIVKRQRNWFSIQWNLLAFHLDYKINYSAKINSRFFGLKAYRKSIGFLENITDSDIDVFQDEKRDRDYFYDRYLNYGNETRFLKQYFIGENPGAFLAGFRFYRGKLKRQEGYGNNGSGPDFSYSDPALPDGIDFTFPSVNFSLFSETIFPVGSDFTITPGIRYEYIKTEYDGMFSTCDGICTENQKTNPAEKQLLTWSQNFKDGQSLRHFPIFGLGFSYKPLENLDIYANISENFRGVSFNDVFSTKTNFRVDPDLKDENGYNADLGVRGIWKEYITFDVSGFYLFYRDRIGITDFTGQTDGVDFYVIQRTNISDSYNLGIESMFELNLLPILGDHNSPHIWQFFANTTLLKSRYIDSEQGAYEGKKVEFVPEFLFKTGTSLALDSVYKLALQYSYTAEQFTDATNANDNDQAEYGLIPSYWVWDLSFKAKWDWYSLSGGVNNLLDHMYYTRRALAYPGPGIIPSDGRSYYLTSAFSF
jgi:Fe(3+) dicitrate transport protein